MIFRDNDYIRDDEIRDDDDIRDTDIITTKFRIFFESLVFALLWVLFFRLVVHPLITYSNTMSEARENGGYICDKYIKNDLFQQRYYVRVEYDASPELWETVPWFWNEEKAMQESIQVTEAFYNEYCVGDRMPDESHKEENSSDFS